MDAYIRNLHRDGVPKEEEEEPKEIKDSEEVILDRMISCPECRERLKKPILLLPCQHNLCQKCAQYIYENQRLLIKNSRNGGARIKCPSCRKEAVLDMHGVHGLTRNLVIEQFIDQLDQIAKNEKVAKVPKSKKVKKYPAPRFVPPMCKEHYNQKQNLYCRSCQELTCSLCKCFGDHTDCHVIPIADATGEDLVSLKHELKSIKDLFDRLVAAIKSYDELIEKSANHRAHSKERTINIFHELTTLLAERKQLMIKQIDSETKTSLVQIDSHLDQYGNILSEQSAMISESMIVLSAQNWVGFIKRSRDDLIPKISTFCQRREAIQQLHLPDSISKFDKWDIDVEHERKEIKIMDFLPTDSSKTNGKS